MDVMGSFVRIDSFKVAKMAHNVTLVDYAVATQHVSAIACNLQCSLPAELCLIIDII